ncbi:hypothetical protein J5N97_026901 [Dioscorea zingiberensis]|uniref:Uncharacterized protein n=1 Tax=Dioscorea zingiberensis TaxID=325984 RepID=A0A9D5H753_9LILI|nr:hypothetical protein J5N97_026901 [Dioscorea zingiberensis]
MNSFSVTRKKTPFQKHREEEEAKKKRAEDETARLYAEFVESFQGSDAPGSKAFVRGGMINPNEKLKNDSEDTTGGAVLLDVWSRTHAPSRFDELPDDFDPSGKLPGSFDDGDPQTTNLYVGEPLTKQIWTYYASVKIMWPRTEEERRRQRNCGFVAFMNRADGQAAKDEMQGVVVYEYELKIGWGKSVSLPAQALPAPPPGHMAIRNKEGGTVILSGPDGPPVTSVTSQNSELVLTPNVPDIMGDTLQRWRTEPFIMITGSGRWIPPSLPTARSPDVEKESATTYAAGRSRVVDVLTESLTLKETPIPTKVARLMLVSDILHNSSAPVKNASAYRTKFEATIPDIMESFNDLYRLASQGESRQKPSRLLSLEEAEKHRGYDRNDDSKYGQSQSSKYSRDDSSWTSSNAGREGVQSWNRTIRFAGWDQHSEEMIQVHGKGSAAALAPTLVIPQPGS